MDFSFTPEKRLLREVVWEFMRGEYNRAVTLELAKKKQFPSAGKSQMFLGCHRYLFKGHANSCRV
ncbi:MAG: hypothetical protein ACUVQ9_04265 [Thermodesulfobacteriota bacterium]